MCLLSVEVGYLKHNGEPYNENDLQVAASAAMLRANTEDRNAELRDAIWEIGHKLKVLEPKKRVIIRDNYWCSGTELGNFFEVNEAKKIGGIKTGTVTELYKETEG
jgi:hypothetical protein